MTSNNVGRDDKITQKIIYFSEAFKDDPLYKFIENKGLIEELFDYESEFLKSINLEEKYNNDETAQLVGASSGQRIINIIKDKKRNFESYIQPTKVGQMYLHDSIVLFKLRMIFFLFSKSYKPNEVGHILGMVDAVGVVSSNDDISIQKSGTNNNIQQAEMKQQMFEYLKPVYDAVNILIQREELHEKAEIQSKKVKALEAEINATRTDIQIIEKELDRYKNENLNLRFNIKAFERKKAELEKPTPKTSEKEKTGFFAKLFGGGKDEAGPVKESEPQFDKEELDLYEQAKVRLQETVSKIEELRLSLVQAKEREKNKSDELKRLIEEGGTGEFSAAPLTTDLKMKLINLQHLASTEAAATTIIDEQIIVNNRNKHEAPNIIDHDASDD